MACRQCPQPEQDGHSFRTWKNIVENSTPKQHSRTEPRTVLNSHVREDFIPLESEKFKKDFGNRGGDKDTKLSTNEKLLHSSGGGFNGYWSNTESEYTPWKRKDYVQDPTGLNEEIHDFLFYIKPRPEEDAIRRDVFDRVEGVIKGLWPQAKVQLFGSCQTGLYLPTSDIDLVVQGKWESLPLRTLENALLENEIADANSIRVLDKATVPIIKVTDKKTQVKIDISFNMTTAVQSAHMIKSYMEQYPALPYLTFVLKQFLENRNLNEVFSGGISSYTVVLMIVSFFQGELNAQYSGQHSNRLNGSVKDVNLGVLLIEFFELYGNNFNYDNVGIRLVGKGSYFPKEKVLGSTRAKTTHLCIEDPLTRDNYIGKRSFRIKDVKRAFEWAYGVLTQGVLNKIPGNESCSILGRIARVRREAIEQRELMLRLSPQISPNCGMPSYASVANGKTRNTLMRSILDVKNNLVTKPRKKPSESSGNTSPNSSKTQNCSNERKTRTYRDTSPSTTETNCHRSNSSVHVARHCCANSNESNGHGKRDGHIKEKGNRRGGSEQSTSSLLLRRGTAEKDRTLHSPTHKPSSPKRPLTFPESGKLKSSRSGQSLKDIRRQSFLCY